MNKPLKNNMKEKKQNDSPKLKQNHKKQLDSNVKKKNESDLKRNEDAERKKRKKDNDLPKYGLKKTLVCVHSFWTWKILRKKHSKIEISVRLKKRLIIKSKRKRLRL